MSKVISLIMAAGQGTRFGGNTHKCLTPVGGENTPFILKQMEKLNDATDIYAFVIVVGHLHESIQDEVGAEFKGRPVHYVYNNHFSDYGSGWSLLQGIHFIRRNLDTDMPLLITEADCLIPTSEYSKLVGSRSSCLVGPRININKSVVVTKNRRSDNFSGFTYDRSHVNVLKLVSPDDYVLGESIQTWYIGRSEVDDFHSICYQLRNNASMETQNAVDWSNLCAFNVMPDWDMNMSLKYYDGIFINLNTPADVEICNAQPWL